MKTFKVYAEGGSGGKSGKSFGKAKTGGRYRGPRASTTMLRGL